MPSQLARRAVWCSTIFPLSASFLVAASLVLPGCDDSGRSSGGDRSASPDAKQAASPANNGDRSDAVSTTDVDAQPSNVGADEIPSTEWTSRMERELNRVLDAGQAGWATEAFSEAASSQLQRLAELLQQTDLLSASAMDSLITDDFRCPGIRPASLEQVFRDGGTVVRRLPLTGHNGTQQGSDAGEVAPIATAERLVEMLRRLPLPTESGADFHVKFKIIHVVAAEDSVSTEVSAEGGGRLAREGAADVGDAASPEASAEFVQWTATWKCEWTKEFDHTPPRLQSIDVETYEEVLAANGGRPWLIDHTAEVLEADAAYRQQLSYGVDYWLQRIEGRLRINRLGHNGLAVGDVNGDGREDLYVCQTGGLPNRLYVAQADSTAVDVSHEAGVDFLDDTTCALLLDLDNDADQDLVVITVAGGLVLSNDGAGRFVPRATLPDCRNAFSLTAADYDGDRLLDIYAGRYWPTDEGRGEIPIPVPYYDAQNGGRNVLLRNAGDWRFVDVTADVGLDADNTRYTMAAAWEDLDADGDVDLYVANDFGRNCLYRNNGGRFTNIAFEAGVEDIASGMSVSFADYDRDGQTDIYVSNMFSSAGNRVTYQRKYEDRFAAEDISKVQRMTRGNSLFRGQGGGKFLDVSEQGGAGMGRWAWGSLFADLNNDAWDDLVVLNGFITTDDTGDL